MTYHVSLCCNDERGNPGPLFAAAFYDEDDIQCVSLENFFGPSVPFEMPPTPPGRQVIRVGDVSFAAHSPRYHEGNLLWNAVDMERVEVIRLVEHLIRNCDFRLDEWDDSEVGQFAERVHAEVSKSLAGGT